MRPSVQIMFGEGFEHRLLELKKYSLQYGYSNSSDYCVTLLIKEDTEQCKIIEAKAEKKAENVFSSKIEDQYCFNFEESISSSIKEKTEHTKAYLTKLYRSLQSLDSQYNKLHFCMYVPLWDKDIWKQVQGLIKIISTLEFGVQLDLIALHSDLASLFLPESEIAKIPDNQQAFNQTMKVVIEEIKQLKLKEESSSGHILVIQNMHYNGSSPDFSEKSIIKILGEFAMLCIENYQQLFGVLPSTNLQTFGLSTLSFDKIYFIEYMLRHCYVYAMDKEKVNEQEVDINKAATEANKRLRPYEHLLSNFYASEIKPKLNLQEPVDRIMIDIIPKLDDIFANATVQIESFISDSTMSIPEKQAILAAILGQDDELLVNDLFNKDALIINDLEKESVKIFIDANNSLLNNEETKEDASLSQEDQPVYFPIDDIKQNRIIMRQSVGYIRSLEKENEKLQQRINTQQDVNKFLIKDGWFSYKGTERKLLSRDDKIELDEYYSSHPVSVSSVDLSDKFTKIKNQEKEGACMAFAFASIYEYFLKEIGLTSPDLSERFLYYNARLKDGLQDSEIGSTLSGIVKALSEYGICTEKVCPYNIGKNEQPSDEAYEDALNRKIKKVLLVERDTEAVKSALFDGYPVAISINLFESFGAGYKGFVQLPTQEDIELMKAGSNNVAHAMTIVGYSDEDKVFKVRNSWGVEFGDHGYCYLPYSYINNDVLTNWCCIITEIETAGNLTDDGSAKDIGVFKIKPSKHTQLHFDYSDANLKLAINRNLIDEQLLVQTRLQQKDKSLQNYYYQLRQRLRNKNMQDKLSQANHRRLNLELDNCKKREASLLTDRQSKLEKTKKTWKFLLYIILSIIVATFLTYKLITSSFWVIIIGAISLTIGSAAYFCWRFWRLQEIRIQYKDLIENVGHQKRDLNSEKQRIDIDFFLSGMILSRLFDLDDHLENSYNAIKSLTTNLQSWYQQVIEEQENDERTKAQSLDIINNQTLEQYAQQHCPRLTANVYLWHFLKNYVVSEEGIYNVRKTLRDTFTEKIELELSDFSISQYICESDRYLYLPGMANDISNLLGQMEKESDLLLHFTSNTGSINPQKNLFVWFNDNSLRQLWTRSVQRAFTITPTTSEIASPYKIVMLQMVDNVTI